MPLFFSTFNFRQNYLVTIFLSQEIFVFLEMLRRTEKLCMNLGAIHAPNSSILTKAFKGQLQTETSSA
jgi:GTP cyclohydrolase I